MNICVLTHTFPRNNKDATAAFMKEFCDGLARTGNKVVVLTPFDSEFSREKDLFKLVTYKYIWPDKFHSLGYSRTMEADVSLRKRVYLLLPFMLLFGIAKLFWLVRKEKVEVINVHWILPNGLIALIVSRFTGIPYFITLPGTDAYLAYRYKLFGVVAKIIASFSSGIISNSSWHLKRIRNLGIKNKPTAVISYPADVSEFRPVEIKRYGSFVVLGVGRLVYKKGFGYLIKAIASLTGKFPRLKLIIGGDGDLKEDLESLARGLRISDRVIFQGNISRKEISNYYNLANVLVAPSIVDKYGNVDGGPVVVAEAMACGKPVILTRILGMADVISDGVNGFIVPQKNSGAIAAAVAKLIKSPALQARMGKANRNLVKSKLSTLNIGREYTAFFKKYVK